MSSWCSVVMLVARIFFGVFTNLPRCRWMVQRLVFFKISRMLPTQVWFFCSI